MKGRNNGRISTCRPYGARDFLHTVDPGRCLVTRHSKDQALKGRHSGSPGALFRPFRARLWHVQIPRRCPELGHCAPSGLKTLFGRGLTKPDTFWSWLGLDSRRRSLTKHGPQGRPGSGIAALLQA